MNPIDGLRERLEDDDESTRAYAAEDAGHDDRPEDVAPLAERLAREPSRAVREAIVNALCRMTGEAVSAWATEMLRSDDAFVRNAGVTVLQSRGAGVFDRLAAAFLEADVDVRKFILDAAAGLRGDGVERVLALGLDDPDLNVRIAAVEHLGGRKRVELRGRFEAIVAGDDDAMMVSTALAALEETGDAGSWAVVERRFGDVSSAPAHLAPQALRVMARCAPAERLGAYFDALPKAAPARAMEWVDGLEVYCERLGLRALPEERFDALRALLDGGSAAVRARVLQLVGRLDAQPGVAALLSSHLDAEDPAERGGAALGMRRLDAPRPAARGGRVPSC